MDSEKESLLGTMAGAQWGLFTTKQAERAGISRALLGSRVRRGFYVRMAPAVYAVCGTRSCWEQSVMAAVLTVGERALASHQTATYLWGLVSSPPNVIEVVTPRWSRVAADFIVHESTDLVPQDGATIDGIPTTNPERAVVDLGASAPHLVERALDTGLRHGLFTLESVARFVGRVARKGRRGVGVIRPFIEQRVGWQGITESTLEDLFRRIVHDFGLPDPTPQREIFDGLGRICMSSRFCVSKSRSTHRARQ